VSYDAGQEFIDICERTFDRMVTEPLFGSPPIESEVGKISLDRAAGVTGRLTRQILDEAREVLKANRDHRAPAWHEPYRSGWADAGWLTTDCPALEPPPDPAEIRAIGARALAPLPWLGP
jgi:hypothetical protein